MVHSPDIIVNQLRLMQVLSLTVCNFIYNLRFLSFRFSISTRRKSFSLHTVV